MARHRAGLANPHGRAPGKRPRHPRQGLSLASRTLRCRRQGTGKSGDVRVIYFTRNQAEKLVLPTLYVKSKTDNLTGAVLKEIRRALED
jgi:hypothetical protein